MAKVDSNTPEPNRVRRIISVARPNHHRMVRVAILIVFVAIIVIFAVLLATKNGGGSSTLGTAHLLFDDRSKSTLSMADTAGKQIYKVNYPQYAYANYEASSPKGEVLLSLGVTTPQESFLFIKNSKAQTLSDNTIKKLRKAAILGSSHHIYFMDEDSVLYVTCPDGSNCVLESLNLQTAKVQTIVDTGAKAANVFQPPVYPLGLSPDRRTVYLRTLLANNLGDNAAAVYAVNLKGETTAGWALSRDADYTPALAPDAKQVVYRTVDTKTTTIGVLNLTTKKTYTTKWTQGAIADLPSVFTWSPDSKKVLFWGSNSIMPRPTFDTSFDINTAYLDTTNSKLTNLQTIKDSAHNQIAYQAWTGSGGIAYELDTSTRAYSFVDPTPQIYNQDISSKKVSKFNTTSGNLKQVVYY